MSGKGGVASADSGLRSRFRAWIAASAWAPLLGKGAAYLGGFLALALVGSGVLSGFLARIAGASAAPVSAPSGVPSQAAAPLSLRAATDTPTESSGAGAATDAGTDAGTDTHTDTHAGTGTDAGTDTHTDTHTDTRTDAGTVTRTDTRAVSGKDAEKPAIPGTGGITADGKVILNLASEEDLRRLPGVGPAKAKAILALRAKLGRFRRPEDLLRVKGIGRRRLARLRPLLLIDAP